MPQTEKAGKRGKKAISHTLTDRELDSIRGAIEALEAVRKKHNLSYEDLLSLMVKGKERVPATIFSQKLSSLEAITKYLKDGLGLSYHKIAELLGRDERNIWHSYNDSLKKHPEQLVAAETQFFIPLKIFAEKRYSILESVVAHLKENYSLNYHAIAVLLKRDDRTIWTVYQRFMKKKNNESKR